MEIAGVERFSLVDWPGRLAAAVFAPGCNMRCVYCHNAWLLESPRPGMCVGVLCEWLKTRQGKLDGVVISGGEPTLQPNLTSFIDRVRALGFQIKLDTNGMRPDTLAVLLETGRLDYVAMDIKAPEQRYEAICGVPVEPLEIDASIRAIIESGVDHEFRTTIHPDFTPDDVDAIAMRIRGARRFVLQRMRPVEGMPSLLRLSLLQPPPGVMEMAERAGRHVGACLTRGF